MMDNTTSSNQDGSAYQSAPIIRGAPNDSGVPDFMTMGAVVKEYVERSVPEILRTMDRLEKGDYVAPEGHEGVLVPWAVYDQLTAPEGGTKSITFRQIRKSPSAEAIDRIVGEYAARVEEHGQEEAREKLKAGIKEKGPKLAATLDAKIEDNPIEAAKLFGLEYKPPETP
jgi:hypothetical protein